MRTLWFSLALAACGGSKSPATVDPDAAVSPDGKPADGMPDAPPIQGKACSATLTEIGRITGASVAPDDRGFYGPTYKQGLYTRDADGDGKADVLAVEYVSSSSNGYIYKIRLFRQGATGFAAPTVSQVTIPQYGPEVNAVGDFNGDHLLDVVFTYSTESPDRAPYLYVATQNADHTFTMQSRVSVSACRSSSDERLFGLAITDVDGDGKDDVLATVSYGGLGAAPEGVSLLRGGATNLSNATCVRSASVANAGYPAEMISANSLTAADFDGDGKVDLLEGTDDGKYELLHATGPATWTAVTGTATAPTWRVTQLNRVPGRTHQDLVNFNISDTTKITRFAVDPTTGITAQDAGTVTQGDTSGFGIVPGVAVGDFNGDGLTDAVIAGKPGSSSDPTAFSVTCDRGIQWDVTTGTFPTAVDDLRTIDLAGDGKLGILARAGSDVVIYSMQ